MLHYVTVKTPLVHVNTDDALLYLSVKLDCVSLIGLLVLVLQKMISD